MKLRWSATRVLACIGLLLPGLAQAVVFSIVVIPDTQFLAERFPQIVEAQMDWIVANRAAENIIYVAHLGDIKDDGLCDNKTVNAGTGGGRSEWQVVDQAFDRLDAANVAYGVVPGNHDFNQVNGTRCPNFDGERPLSDFNEIFGPARFAGKAHYGDPAAGTRGNREEFSNEDNFTLFGFGGVNFIAINLAYKQEANQGGDTDELEWANDLLQTYSDRLGILTSHYFVEENGRPGEDPNEFSTYGRQVYEFLAGNPNFFMMLSAHRPGEAWRINNRTGMGPVHALLSDYQDLAFPGADGDPNTPFENPNPALINFGNMQGQAFGPNSENSGFMRIMRFDTDTGLVNVDTFTPPVTPLAQNGGVPLPGWAADRPSTLVSTHPKDANGNPLVATPAHMGRFSATRFSLSFEGYVDLVAGPANLAWSIAGQGTTSATEAAPGEWDLSYSSNPAGLSITRTWTVTSSPATAAGDYTFDWNYSGHHAFFNVRAFLTASDGTTLVNTGPANCCTSPSAGFSYSGSHTFTGVQVGDTIGFSMGGSNFDSNNFLNGTLNLVQVPQ